MDNYLLNKSKNKYKDMKDYIEKMVRELSKSSVLDNISKAQTCLSSYYLVNDTACKYNKIGDQKEEIREVIRELNDIINTIDNKIDDIQDDIEKNEKDDDGFSLGDLWQR